MPRYVRVYKLDGQQVSEETFRFAEKMDFRDFSTWYTGYELAPGERERIHRGSWWQRLLGLS